MGDTSTSVRQWTTVDTILDLCDEALLEIFSYLPHPTRAKCALVCKRFFELSRDPSLFRQLSPVIWSQGIWDSAGLTATVLKIVGSGALHTRRYVAGRQWQNPDARRGKHERRLFRRIATGLLPSLGHAVRILDLSFSSYLQDNYLQVLLIMCPNISDLDVSNCTELFLNKFYELHTYDVCRKLKKLNLSNCNIDDNSIFLITRCWMIPQPPNVYKRSEPCMMTEEEQSQAVLHFTTNGKVTDNYVRMQEPATAFSQIAGIQSLNLSGCSKLTDACLRHFKGVLPALSNLEKLDLSGCYQLTGPALKDFVSFFPSLKGENVAYCDHIKDGPFVKEASGCLNLQQENCCVSPE